MAATMFFCFLDRRVCFSKTMKNCILRTAQSIIPIMRYSIAQKEIKNYVYVSKTGCSWKIPAKAKNPDNCRYSPAESLLANIDRKKTGLTRKGGSFMTYLQEDDILGIVRITEKEKETYYQMSKYRSFIKDIYDEVFKAIWEKFITGIIIMFAVYEKKTNSICAFCQLDMQNPAMPEFGLDVVDGYMDKGYGTRAVVLVYQYASSWDNIDYFTWKADSDNIKSRKIAEHLGGQSISERYFLPDSVIEYGMEKGILQEGDLSTVCKYKIQKGEGHNMAQTYKKLTDYIPIIEDDRFGEWIIDRENDGTKEHPIHFPYVSYSEMVTKLEEDIYGFEYEHPEYGLNRYVEILKKNHIEWKTESMLGANLDALDGKSTMALLVGAVRAERFCDGVLLDFFKKGAISKWLKRLAEIDKEG